MNWGQLKAAVTAYTHRSDLGPMFPTFLALAEQRIYIGEVNTPKVRVSAMRKTATLADGTRPAGFLEAVKISNGTTPNSALLYTPISDLDRSVRSYTWDGLTLALSKDQGFPLTMVYMEKPATPVLDTDENWVMANAPGVYLAALLVDVYRWAVDDVSAAREASNYTSAANSLISQDKAASISGSPLVQKRWA